MSQSTGSSCDIISSVLYIKVSHRFGYEIKHSGTQKSGSSFAFSKLTYNKDCMNITLLWIRTLPMFLVILPPCVYHTTTLVQYNNIILYSLCILYYVDGKIILRWIFRKLEGVVGTGWSWLRIGTGGGHL